MITIVKNLIEIYWDAIVEHRRWLHAHPELSEQEKDTAAYIAEALRGMGLNPVEHVGGYGVTALIEGELPGKCVGLRADFDALPVTECTGLPFASQNPGVMHACGHDVHAAMLLGAARILCDLRPQLCGTVKLIFQPAEEMVGGADKMIAEGVLQNPRVGAVIGQHVEAALGTGKIAFREDTIMASCDDFVITIHGKGGHAAAPENAVDAIAIGAQVVSALQQIVSRNVSPQDSAVITIGTVSGGTANNVIAETVEMAGTCRNLDPDIRNAMPGRIESIVRGVAEGMGATYTFDYEKGYPPVVNDAAMCDLLQRAATEAIGAENVVSLKKASLGAEDFAFFAERVPSVFYRLGCLREGEKAWPLHNGHFNPDEDAMKTGILVMTTAALRFLSGK